VQWVGLQKEQSMPHVDNNPFSLVFSELWNMLEAKETFKDLVKEGNRIRYDKQEKRDILKSSVATADLPEVVLSIEGMTPSLFRSSSQSDCVCRYAWMISTGDLRVIERIHPVDFAIFAAMTGWQEKLGALEWNEKTFVKRATISDVTHGQSIPEMNRGIKGWSSIWAVDVLMVFATKDLIAFA